MKVIILAGGKGTRLSHLTNIIPKPMVKIGNKPIIINIIEHYCDYGFNDILISTGYKNNYINNYFIKLAGKKKIQKEKIIKKKNFISIQFKSHKISLVYTGKNTSTSGRINKLKKYIQKEIFMFTYGDGLSNINLKKLLSFHNSHKCILTVSAVRPPARFGELKISKNVVKSFDEKPQLQKGWINGGFFVADPKFLKYLNNNDQMLEREPIQKITSSGQLKAFKHKGFWQCMDNLRDYNLLKELNKLTKPPWKKYK